MSEELAPVVALAPDECWKIHAHDMAGVVHIVPCPKNAQTLVADIKRAVETVKPEYVFERTILTVRLKEAANADEDAHCAEAFSPDSANSSETRSAPILHNHHSMIQCGLGDGTAFDVFVQDIVWRPKDRAYQEKIMEGATVASFQYCGTCDKIDAETAAAVAWTLTLPDTKLRQLFVEMQRIGDNGVVSLAAALTKNQVLEKLTISCDSIYGDGGTAIAQALHTNTSLRLLQLSHNHIGNAGAISFGRALTVNFGLQALNLDFNDISDGSIPLFRGLHSNSSLRALNVWGNYLEDTGVEAFADMLLVNTGLHFVCLKDTQFGVRGAVALSAALRVNATLKVLDIAQNHIYVGGASAIGEALQVNHSLRALDMTQNKIGRNGIIQMANALRTNSCLRDLFVSENRIDDIGVAALADALQSNSCLEVLILSCNRIGNDGAKSLAVALRANSCLTHLDLAQNEISEVGAVALGNALRDDNRDLLMLDLQRNALDHIRHAALFTETLRSNQHLHIRLAHTDGVPFHCLGLTRG